MHLQILHVVLHLHLDTVPLIILSTFELLISIPERGHQELMQDISNLNTYFFASLSKVHLSLASQLS